MHGSNARQALALAGLRLALQHPGQWLCASAVLPAPPVAVPPGTVLMSGPPLRAGLSSSGTHRGFLFRALASLGESLASRPRPLLQGLRLQSWGLCA